MLRQLEALCGRGSRFEDYRAQLSDRIVPIARSFSNASLLDTKVDMVFSNNTLQHIHEIDECLKWIREISAADTGQLHVVYLTHHESPTDRSKISTGFLQTNISTDAGS